MKIEVGDYLTSAFNAPTSKDIWLQTSRFFESLGFENVVYGVRHPQAGSTPLKLLMTPSLDPWKSDYLERKDDERDPLFSYAAQMPPSFYTGREFLHLYGYLTPEDREVINRGATFGFISGIAFVMPRHDETVVAGWHIMTDKTRDDALACFAQNESLMQMAANVAHREMVGRDGIQAKTPSHLSPRQIECLQWLAAGIRNDQIADKMNIRPVTVELHLRKAREQLGANTREQALAIAISDGIISL